MKYNFDAQIDRSGTHSVKYDLRKAYFGREDLIPMWVADMDFAVPPFVLEAVRKRAEHPIYGYSMVPGSYIDALIAWENRRHHRDLEIDWISFSPGIVTGLNMIVQSLTEPGDEIIVQPPVYFPFFSSVEKNSRKLLYNQLLEKGGRYTIDFDDLETKMKGGARMLILCNPHNPVGRCWTKEELAWIGEKSIEYGVLVVSDEIHCDLVFEPSRHIPFANLSKETADLTITCIAPSKTFNLAGLFTSSVIISNDALRSKYKAYEERLHLNPNIFGITAATAAYSEGEAWLSELMDYLSANARLVQEFLGSSIPEITSSSLESTYLMWLDFRKWDIPPDELKKLLIGQAGLGFVDGREFGPGGKGFQRMNIASPSSLILQALERLFSLRKSLGY